VIPVGFDYPFDVPEAEYAECYILGTLMRWGEGLANCGALDSRDFSDKHHPWIWRTITDLDNEGKPYTIDAVEQRLRAEGCLEDAGGIARLLLYETIGTTPATLHVHAATLRKERLKRELHEVALRLERDASEEHADPDVLIDGAEAELISLQAQQEGKLEISAREIAREAMRAFEERYKHRGEVTGVPTGLDALDAMTLGLQPTEMVVLAARPSMGKTALGLTIIENACMKRRIPTVLFSIEMGRESIRDRLYAMIGKVDGKRLRQGNFAEHDWGRLARATEEIGASPLTMFDVPLLTLAEMRASARKLHAKGKCKLVVVDYLQKMTTADAENRERGIAEISQGLKALAKELRIPVLVLAQLNRAVEQRNDKRPMMSDLRESGAIEQDADVILFLYRDEVYNEESEDKGIAEIIIGKQRNGELGTARVAWRPEFARFDNLTRSES
jgi:replicative DNA helicase